LRALLASQVSVDEAAPPSDELVTPRGLWQALSGWRGLFVVSAAFNVLGLLAGAAALAAGAWAVSRAVTGAGSDALVVPAIVVFAATVVRSMCAWIETWLAHDLAFRMLARTRLWVYQAVARVAPVGLQRKRTGDLLTSAMSDAEALEIYYAHSSIYAFSAWVATPLLWVGLAVFSLPAALAVLPVILVAVATTLLARRWSIPQGAAIRAALADLGSEVAEDAGAVREIMGYRLVDRRRAALARADDRLASAQYRNARRAAGETAAMGVVALVAGLASAAAVGWQLGNDRLDPALVPIVVVLGVASTSAILQWTAMTRHYGATKEASARISRLLDAKSPLAGFGSTGLFSADRADVSADGVTFAWRDVDDEASDRKAVSEVTVTIEAGESVAIAGRSGAGKSTFAQLLARFMDPSTGVIEVSGTGLTDYTQDSLPTVVSLLPQDVSLFNETVRQNLLLAVDRVVDDNELWEALITARADALVRRLPGGLDAELSENGASLSGGERQRLALAQAVLHPAAVLILDEAVSQLDSLTESEVQDALNQVRAGHTTLTIAHRLSTLLRAQRILVLDDGKLVGDGTHEELIASCEPYRRLVLPQLRAFQ